LVDLVITVLMQTLVSNKKQTQYLT